VKRLDFQQIECAKYGEQLQGDDMPTSITNVTFEAYFPAKLVGQTK